MPRKPIDKKAPSSEFIQEQNLEEVLRFVEKLKRKWVATIDALVDPLMIVSSDYKILKANWALARFAGITDIRGLGGKKCFEVFAKRKDPCPNCQMLLAAKEQKAQVFNLKNIRDKYYFEATAQPIYDDSNKLEGIVLVYRDRSEAMMLQEKLLQNEKLASIGLLAGGFAHEINNPLGGILIFSQILLREMPKDSPFYADVVEIEAATQRCKGIVERLLDFARKPSTIKKTKETFSDVNAAIKNAVRFAKVHRHARKIDIQDKLIKNSYLAKVEHNTLIQLFLNLIQNAFQAMPDGGTLCIKNRVLKLKDGSVIGKWQISDTGIGITEEAQKNIFDPFFTTKEPGYGTGLGLSICYGICQEAQGTIEVKSKLNKGSSFTVILPLFHNLKKIKEN